MDDVQTADTRGAVLLDNITTMLAKSPDGAGRIPTIMLEGRINQTEGERSRILFLMSVDGAAELVSQIIGLHKRHPDVAEQFEEELAKHLGQLPADDFDADGS